MKWKLSLFVLLIIFAVILFNVLQIFQSTKEYFVAQTEYSFASTPNTTTTTTTTTTPARREGCAINFYGLPRAFESLVLPSIVKNVWQTNQQYNCDVFVHYYNLTTEPAGRSGRGGNLNPHQIRLLTSVIKNNNQTNNATTTTTTAIRFAMTQEQEFWIKYNELLQKIQTVKETAQTNRLLYFPWKETSYSKTTIANIIKMWHSIQSAFQLMKKHGQDNNIRYTRVAMLRSDVLFLTPIDIWQRGTTIERN